MVHSTHVVSVLDHLIAGEDNPHSPALSPTALIAPNLGTDNVLRISMTITQPNLCAHLIEALHDEASHRVGDDQHHCPIAVDLNFPALFAAWYRSDSDVDVDTLIEALNDLSSSARAADIYMHVRLNDYQPHEALPVALLGVFTPRPANAPLSAATVSSRVTHFRNTTRIDQEEPTTTPPPAFAFHAPQLADLLGVPILGAIAHTA